MITIADLQAISGSRTRSKTTQNIADAFNRYAAMYGVTSQASIALYLAHICVETGGFRSVAENMNYSASRLMKVWPSRFKTLAVAKKYERRPEALTNYVYGSRMGNAGKPNAGWLYRGSGPGQVTGYDNFKRIQDETGMPVVENPELLRSVDSGMRATLVLWQKWDMNGYAETGRITDSRKRWNGGTHGLNEVKQAYARGMKRNLVGRSVPIPTPAPRPEPTPEPPSIPDIIADEPLLPDHPDAVEEVLRESGSRTINGTDVVERVSLWGSLVATVKYAIDQVTDTLKDLPEIVWVVLIIAAAGFVWYKSRKIKAARVEDAITGKNISRIEEIRAFVGKR